MTIAGEIRKGVFRENPIFVLMLGLCPTLAVTTSVKNGFFMGLATMVVLVCSNAIISVARRHFPSQIRIPCFIIIIASFVTMVDLLMSAFAPPAVVAALGIFIPLIVVNCVILGRAEAFAAKKGPILSIADGIGMGVGFGLALMGIALLREVLGAGSFWDRQIVPFFGGGQTAVIRPMAVMALAPGAFMLIGIMFAFFNWRGARKQRAAAAKLVGDTPDPVTSADFKKTDDENN